MLQPLAKGNVEIVKLLIGHILAISAFYKKHDVSSKDLKKFYIWHQVKKTIKSCPVYYLYIQVPLTTGSNLRSTHTKEWNLANGCISLNRI